MVVDFGVVINHTGDLQLLSFLQVEVVSLHGYAVFQYFHIITNIHFSLKIVDAVYVELHSPFIDLFGLGLGSSQGHVESL